MHRTLTWTTGSLSFCKRIHMGETSVYSLIRRTFVRICAEFDFGEVSWRAQSLTRDGEPSRWRPRSIALHSAFESGCSATGSPVLQLIAVVLLLPGVTTQVCCRLCFAASLPDNSFHCFSHISLFPPPPLLLVPNEPHGFCGR